MRLQARSLTKCLGAEWMSIWGAAMGLVDEIVSDNFEHCQVIYTATRPIHHRGRPAAPALLLELILGMNRQDEIGDTPYFFLHYLSISGIRLHCRYSSAFAPSL